MSVFVLAECIAMEDNNNTQISFPDKVLFNIFCKAARAVENNDQAIELFKAIQLTCKLGTNENFVNYFEQTVTRKYTDILRRIKSVNNEIKHDKAQKAHANFAVRRIEQPAFSTNTNSALQTPEQLREKELDELYEQQETFNRLILFFHRKQNYKLFLRWENRAKDYK